MDKAELCRKLEEVRPDIAAAIVEANDRGIIDAIDAIIASLQADLARRSRKTRRGRKRKADDDE